MIEEIESGIRNALERGSSLDEAVQSFITAGYNPVEVREAAKNVSQGASNIISPDSRQNLQSKQQQQFQPLPSQSSQIQQPNPIQQTNQDQFQSQQAIHVNQFSPISTNSTPLSNQYQSTSMQQAAAQAPFSSLPQPKSSKKKTIIILVIILLILLALLITGIFFGQKILDLIA